MKNERFYGFMSETERNTWQAFRSVVNNFFGNTDKCILKIHFLRLHLDCFPDNCGDYSEEKSELFHQDILTMKESYQGRWDINMLADYCWCLRRDLPGEKHKRKSLRKPFLPH